MKKIITLSFAFWAIFYSALASEPTTADSFKKSGNYPETMIVLKDTAGNDCGLLFVHDEDSIVKVFFLIAGHEVKARSKEAKMVEKLVLKTYYEQVSKQKVKVVKKIYSLEKKGSEGRREKYFTAMVLKKIKG